MESWVRPEIRALAAYKVPQSEGLIKLDAMENPWSWPESMQVEWLDTMKNVSVNRYPDASAEDVITQLRANFDVPVDMGVLLGNGSDELIQIIQLCLSGPDRVVLSLTPSFSMYEMIAEFVGMKFVAVPLADDYAIDRAAVLSAIEEHDPAIVFLSYPNNPTGNLFERAAIDEIIVSTRGLVVVDEAYNAFAGRSYYDRLGMYENLVVMRTLSKLGLAGLRLGFLAGPNCWLDEFKKVRLPYNIGTLTQATVRFALDRLEVFEEQARLIISERQRVFKTLMEIDRVTPFPSETNFLLFRSDFVPAGELNHRLLGRGVLIKAFGSGAIGLDQCMRVSIGTQSENDAFLSALKDCLR